LSDREGFPHETTLAKVKVKFAADAGQSEEFTVDDIKYNGKVTARGTSFRSHLTLISQVYRRYARAINGVETEYSLRGNRVGRGMQILGKPMCFTFGRRISDLEGFCHSLFNCSEPFRLWGVPVPTSANMCRVVALDLHVGARLTFEIGRTFMRVYLPKGTCGNTILRIYTNLQHHYDALVTPEEPHGEAALVF
jgi:hypothetical protein